VAVNSTAPPTLDEFYRERYAVAVRLAYGLVGDRSTAEELVQDVFVRISGRFVMLDNPDAYLRTSIVNAARSHMRRRILERRNAQGPPDPSTPSHLVEFADVLKRLNHRQRIAIVLRFFEGLDDDTIADMLGCRRATVRSLVHRGLASLREVLPDE